MKIEELFVKQEPSFDITEQEERVRSSAKKPTIIAPKKSFKPQAISEPSSSRRRERSSAHKQRQARSKMKLEQVNRHEEYSFLLEAETNQAILENIVCKDEICRYLTPLKFIEIDTWRRDVPYGLTHDKEIDRRKWRTPLEILYGGTTQQGNRGQNERSTSKKSKRQTVSAHHKIKRKNYQQYEEDKEISEKSVELQSGEADVFVADQPSVDPPKEESAYKARDVWQRRPATSPERKVILSKVRNEKILSRNQISTTAQKPSSGNVFQTRRSRVYNSCENLQTSPGFYNPSSLSSASLRRRSSHSPPSGLKILSLLQDQDNNFTNAVFKPQDMKFSQFYQRHGASYAAKFPAYSANQGLKSHFSSVRPRTRGHNCDKTLDATNENNITEVKTSKGPHPPEDLKNRNALHSHLDPNIAYIPPTSRQRNNSKNAENLKNGHSPSRSKALLKTNPNGLLNAESFSPKAPSVVVEETIRLPRTSMFSSNHSTPRADDVTPRIIQSSDLLTSRSWTSKVSSYQSPWVIQALPDFSDKEVAAKARREGYYVRKPSKTVSFKAADGEHNRVSGRQRNEDSLKNNISMVVVNVDEPRGDSANNLLSHGGAIKLSQKQTNFTNGNVISVRL